MVKINQNSSNTKKRSKVKKTRKCNNKQKGGARGQANNIKNYTPYLKKIIFLREFFTEQKPPDPNFGSRLDRIYEIYKTNNISEGEFIRVFASNGLKVFNYLKDLNIKNRDDFERLDLFKSHFISSNTLTKRTARPIEKLSELVPVTSNNFI